MIAALQALIIVLITESSRFHKVRAENNLEEKLLSHLFENYSAEARPVLNISDPISVEVGLELVQIVSIVERDNQITNKLWLRLSWVNELMKWDPDDWDGFNCTSISPSSLWVPDLVLYQEIDESMYETTTRYKARIDVDYDGTHSWNIPMVVTSSCKIHVKDFPFDQQTCQIKVASWSYDITKLNLAYNGNPIITDQYFNSSEWILKHASSRLNIKKYGCCINPFTDMTFTFVLKRKPLFYLTIAVGPCVLMLVIILFSFFLPCDSVERMNLLVTMLLVFVVFLQLVSDVLPRNSDSTSALSVFYLTLMVESACSLVATCIVVFLYLKGSSKGVKPVPESIRRAIMEISKITSLMYKRQEELHEKNMEVIAHKSRKRKQSLFETFCDQTREQDIQFQWELLATILNGVFFIIFLIVYVITVLVFLL